MRRCRWVNDNNPLYIAYHDEEWGIPTHEDSYLYEILLLECFVAGLSWECVLNKREAFRQAFAGCDASVVAAFGPDDVARLMADTRIIRHRGKIEAAISNSRVFLDIQAEFSSFAAYAWHFTKGEIVREPWHSRTSSPLSDAVSRDLRRRGMRFVGTVTIYSWLQAVGIICGHGHECDYSDSASQRMDLTLSHY